MARWTDFLDPMAPGGRFLRWREVETRVGISRTTAWRLQKKGDFPAPYVISTGRVGYRESEVAAWTASRAHRREPLTPAPASCAQRTFVQREDCAPRRGSPPQKTETAPEPRRAADPQAPDARAPGRPRTRTPARQATFDF